MAVSWNQSAQQSSILVRGQHITCCWLLFSFFSFLFFFSTFWRLAFLQVAFNFLLINWLVKTNTCFLSIHSEYEIRSYGMENLFWYLLQGYWKSGIFRGAEWHMKRGSSGCIQLKFKSSDWCSCKHPFKPSAELNE